MKEEEKRRYVGIDLGKREYTMAIIGKNEKMSIHQGKTSIQGRQTLCQKLEATDKIALEAGNMAFVMAKEMMERIGCEVRVLNSAKLPFIWDTPTKTDKEDSMKLARLIDEDMKNLQTIPGVGSIVAYAFTAHVGDGSRFSKGAQVSNYIGFVPRLDYSGTIQRHGHISKRGNSYLRGLLVQAAWMTVRCKQGGALRTRYTYYTLCQGSSKKKTVVSIARKLTEYMYSILRSKTVYEPRRWNGPQEKRNSLSILKDSA